MDKEAVASLRWELEQRGFRLELTAESELRVVAPPRRRLTGALATRVETLREDLIAVLLTESGAPAVPAPTAASLRALRGCPCPCCGQARWWLSVHGAVICQICHPPASSEQITETEP